MKKTDLIPLNDKHLEMVLDWRNTPAVRKNMYTNHIISMPEHLQWFHSMQSDPTKKYFVFQMNESPLGVVGFSEINRVKGVASWAFYANPEAIRGTGSLMEFSALEYAFNELSLHKLRCEVLAFNLPVIKLHQKFGFKVEGEHRDAHFDGQQYHNVVHLGILNTEWKELRDKLKIKLRVE